MFNIKRKEIEWGGKKLVLETGKIARQADGAVVATQGGTSVLCCVTFEKKPKEGADFFPLTVNYLERYYAAGKIPGGFFKREGRPTEKEILTSRLIDRPIRPMFDENYKNETQVVCTVVSYDGENEPDVLALVGASAALAVSGVPFNGPIGGARVGIVDGEYVLNPSIQQMAESTLDLFVAGTATSVLMVESEAKELSEDKMLGAVMFGHKEFQAVIAGIKELARESGKQRWEVKAPDIANLQKRISDLAANGFRDAYKEKQKQIRQEKIKQVEEGVKAALAGDAEPANDILVKGIVKHLQADIVRNDILDTKHRIDGRDEKTVRPILAEVGVLPRTHGSALFTRGETQALVIVTLGSGEDEQILDNIEGDRKEHFMLHYNFPPYSVGEATQLRPPGRREIGHGKLAWRAVHALMPTKEEFPYTIRVVSEITESNGSSSMASVCGASLAMMDSGVPLKRPIAGIAMGLILEGERYAILSDIMGDEDHLGDMDFKVAGTTQGITALQMDIKIQGITENIMKVALAQANEGRMHILGEMAKALSGARETVNENAPKIINITVPKDKIREVIGSGGKVIREICEKTGAKIDIDDNGNVAVSGANADVCNSAIEIIKGIVSEAEIGKIYTGKVVRIVDFGAFVNFLGAKDGLVHISEIADYRVEKVTDVLAEGDEVKVKVIGEDRGKVKLSMKVVDQKTGEDNSANFPPREERPKRDRDDRPRDRDRNRGPRGGGNRDRGDRGGDRPRRDYGDRPRRNRDDNFNDNRGDNRGNRDYKPAAPAPEEKPKKRRLKFFG